MVWRRAIGEGTKLRMGERQLFVYVSSAVYCTTFEVGDFPLSEYGSEMNIYIG